MRKGRIVLPISACALSAGAAFAQVPAGGIGDIVVTAQRRAENMQDVPIAVSAFNGADLDNNHVQGLSDLVGRAPGFVINSFTPGQPEIAIRGIGTKEDGAGASDSTLVMVDGVYFATRTATNIDIFDLERVEVLRGPQGTLFGKNAIAGVVNYVTRKPSNEFELRLRQTVGRFSQFDTAAAMNMPITDKLAARFSFSRRDDDGYIYQLPNIPPSKLPYGTHRSDAIGGSNRFAWRAAAGWKPDDTVNVLLALDGARDRLGADNREPVGSAGPLHNCGCASDSLAVNRAFGGDRSPYSYAGDVIGYSNRDIFGAMLQVDKEFSFATLTVLGAYRDSSYDNVLDSGGLPAAPVIDMTGGHGNPNAILLGPATSGFTFDNVDVVNEDAKQYTGEIRLTSPDAGRLRWVAGLYGSAEDIDRSEGVGFDSLADASLVPQFAISEQSFEGRGAAGYLQASYRFSDRFTLTAGGRYSYEKKKIAVTNRIPTSPGIMLLLEAFPLTRGEADWDNFTWKISADYKPADDMMVYATISTGFKSGGFTGTATTAVGATTPFNPEKATNYEIGGKFDLFDRRVRLNIAGFYIDYSDLQVTRFFQPPTSGFGEFITENAADATIKGIEAELTVRPSDWLEVGGTYSYLDAKYDSFYGTPDISGTGDFSGNRMRQAPQHLASGYVELSQTTASGARITAHVSGRYQSKLYTNADNNPLDVIPGYFIGDAWLSWTAPDRRWDIQGWVKNFTDKAYRTHVFTQRGNRLAVATFGAPVTYGMTVSFTY
jgi:iron complex outermembrane receptor protein